MEGLEVGDCSSSYLRSTLSGKFMLLLSKTSTEVMISLPSPILKIGIEGSVERRNGLYSRI